MGWLSESQLCPALPLAIEQLLGSGGVSGECNGCRLAGLDSHWLDHPNALSTFAHDTPGPGCIMGGVDHVFRRAATPSGAFTEHLTSCRTRRKARSCRHRKIPSSCPKCPAVSTDPTSAIFAGLHVTSNCLTISWCCLYKGYSYNTLQFAPRKPGG